MICGFSRCDKRWKDCPYRNIVFCVYDKFNNQELSNSMLLKKVDVDDDWYEPIDYSEGDIGSAIVAEMRRQNGE